MCHPLYPVARRMVGRRVNIHHRCGSVYRGTLHSVANHGIYVAPYQQGYRMMASEDDVLDVTLLDDTNSLLTADATQVYAPYSYYAFGALTGLTLGVAAGAFLW